jgi:hypothetical protein
MVCAAGRFTQPERSMNKTYLKTNTYKIVLGRLAPNRDARRLIGEALPSVVALPGDKK